VSEVALEVTRVLICENDPIMRSALCDLVDSVPGGGGPRAARVIGQHIPHARLIAYPAFADREVVVAMLRAGVDEYLVKGVDDAHLVDAIRRTGRVRIGLPAVDLQELLLDLAHLLADAEARLESAERRLAFIAGPAR
jgi:DNA-binding NarL/FixJ family response regulator